MTAARLRSDCQNGISGFETASLSYRFMQPGRPAARRHEILTAKSAAKDPGQGCVVGRIGRQPVECIERMCTHFSKEPIVTGSLAGKRQ
jgi:hypothetical protein